MQKGHLKILWMHSYDLPLWILFLLHVWVRAQSWSTWMYYSIRFELFRKSSLGHWTSRNVLLNKSCLISSMSLFHKLFKLKTCHSSSIVQLIVHNNHLSNNNRCINLFSFVILCVIDNIFGAGIFVSTSRRAL